LDGISFLFIDPDERNWLERDFEEHEVWEVVRDMNGPDGFFMDFFSEVLIGNERGLLGSF
jgi:hypothetical protein